MADNPTSTAAPQQPNSFEGSTHIYYETTQFVPGNSSQFPLAPAKENKERRTMAMATPMTAGSKKLLDISSLMSPPELPPFDSFAQGTVHSPNRPILSEQRTIPHPPLSPPISPFTKLANSIDPAPAQGVAAKDPILYPTVDPTSSPIRPLFGPGEARAQTETQRVVDEHITARPSTLFRESTPPKREHYELALYFKSAVMHKFIENPRGWLRKERELLALDRKNYARPKLTPILPAAPGKSAPNKALAIRNANPNKVKKPRSRTPARSRTPTKKKLETNVQNNAQAGAQPTPPRPIRATPTVPPREPSARQPAARQPGARQPAVGDTIRVSMTPEPRVRTVAPNREDKDFSSLDDYSPPVGSLPNKPNSLKVDWKGNPLDLSNDPYASLLHPDERQLAAGLRLDCATYLTSKRRIFIRRLECARIGKEFRKTDAQQACKIDVNKASKLWAAYDKVGWLNIQWMRDYL